MKKRFSLLGAICLLFAVATLIPAAQAAGPRVVTTSGRNILVDGQPFVVKGYNYTTDVNATWPLMAFADDPVACVNDAKLLAGAGVNALRIWWTPTGGSELVNPQAEFDCLDALWAQGIGVIWTISNPAGRPNIPGYMEEYKITVDQAVARFKNHPATLMWLLGNEWELICGEGPDLDGCRNAIFGVNGGQVSLLNQLMVDVKAADPNHLVGVTICCNSWAGGMQFNIPALEVWGVNWYPSLHFPAGVAAFDAMLDQLSTWDAARPKVFTEMGVDRIWCLNTLAGVPGTSGPCRTVGGLEPPHSSGEYQVAQADYFATAWDRIVAHGDDAAGATFFMFSDMWNKCSLFCGGVPGGGLVHDVYPEAINNSPDGPNAAEWWGVAGAVVKGSPYMRYTSLAFDALARRWSSVTPPTITSGPVFQPQTSPCTYENNEQYKIRATWTTDLPSTTEVYYSLPGEILTGGGDMVADNSRYEPVASDATLTTNHSIVFDAKYLGRGRAVVRSFTAGGQSVTHPPIDLTCGDFQGR